MPTCADCRDRRDSRRPGTGVGFVERVLRQAIEEAPEVDLYRPWLAAEFRRGLARELADAGRALSRYDAQPWAGQLGLPAAMLITTRDQLVRPSKQRELAGALRAHVIEIDVDHDLPLVRGKSRRAPDQARRRHRRPRRRSRDPAGLAPGQSGPKALASGQATPSAGVRR
jgi:hypothetical protein